MPATRQAKVRGNDGTRRRRVIAHAGAFSLLFLTPSGGDHDTDCVNVAAEQLLRGVAARSDLRGKVLMTTRLLPHALKTHGGFALQGCCAEELAGL